MGAAPAHELRYTDAEREAAFIERRLGPAAELVRGKPSNLGPFLNEALRLLGFRASFGRPAGEIFDALELARDFGVGLFLRGGASGSERVSFSIRGEPVEVPGGPTRYNSALRWLESFGVAHILRDGTAVDTLRAYDPDNFEGLGGYDAYHISFARALRAFDGQASESEALLDQAAREVQDARVAPERARRIGVPLIELARAVHLVDQNTFNEALRDALAGYRAAHAAGDDARRAEAFVPVVHVGLCAIAHDRGMRIEVESGYLPDWLLRGAA